MYNHEIQDAIKTIRNAEIDASCGMSEELFMMISGLIPICNVDLLIENSKGQILLSWRDDDVFEKGWHIPGGCMRYGESFEKRIQETATRELGQSVTFEADPIAVKNVYGNGGINIHKRERGHHIALLFRCRLVDESKIKINDAGELKNGDLRWFDSLPDNILKLHFVYKKQLEKWINNKE